MKLLVVGHSYVTAFAQAKYVAMKALRPDLAIRVVVPAVVRHTFGDYRPELASGLRPEELVVIRSFGGDSNMTYMLDPIALGSLLRRFEPTHVHIEEDPHSAIGVEVAWLASRTCPDTVLSFFIWDNLNRIPRFPVNLLKRRLTRFGLSRTSLMICGNQQAKSLLAAKGYHGASEVIPQLGLTQTDGKGAVLQKDPPGERKPGTPPTIGYFGRLVEEKGILDLLHALHEIRDHPWRLLIYGDGPLRSEVRDNWQRLLGDRLICADPVPHARVQKELASLDVFVLPSYTVATWKEQFGLTLAQAMLTGCACIGSSCGAIPEVLGGTGLVFPERDVSALRTALRTLLGSASERARLGAAARAFALGRYTNEAIATRYLRAFDAATN